MRVVNIIKLRGGSKQSGRKRAARKKTTPGTKKNEKEKKSPSARIKLVDVDDEE